jgi:hypothetical protein
MPKTLMVRRVHKARDSQHGEALVGIPTTRKAWRTTSGAFHRDQLPGSSAASWIACPDLARARLPARGSANCRDWIAPIPPHRPTPWPARPVGHAKISGDAVAYFEEPDTTRLFFTEKTLGTPLARKPARFLSVSLSATPSKVTFPFFTTM